MPHSSHPVETTSLRENLIAQGEPAAASTVGRMKTQRMSERPGDPLCSLILKCLSPPGC